jgi:hypothetical protein
MRYKPTLPLVQVFPEESPNRRRPGKEPARRQEIGGASSFWSGVCDSRRELKHEENGMGSEVVKKIVRAAVFKSAASHYWHQPRLSPLAHR